MQIYHELNQMNKLTHVLYLAAHPDDENTRMLGWLVNEEHVPTAYLSLTRGDGGQNILGPHLGPALGLIRTHELLEARKLDGGAGQFFTRAVDFGYSKTADETFKHWSDDQLTADVVWVMRKFRPDVIICRFPPNENAGHGQHAASAILGHKAFNAAGDKTKYTDQLKYYAPWQPERILFNAYRFGNRNTTSEDQFKLEVGQYNPLLGMGYGELAGISRSIHRSQGAGTRSVPGIQTEYLDLVDGSPIKNSLFDGIDTTWGRVGRKEIGEHINKLISEYDFNHPEKSLAGLLKLRTEIRTVKDDFWREEKLKDLDKLILHCAGFMAEEYTDKPEVTRGEQVKLTLNLIARSDIPVIIMSTGIPEIKENTVLEKDKTTTISREITIPDDQPYTQPYWLSSPQKDNAHYPIPSYDLLGLPLTPDQLTTDITVKIDTQTFVVNVPLSYKTLDATHGDVTEPLRVVPKVTVNFTSNMQILEPFTGLNLPIHIHSEVDVDDATVNIAEPMFSKSIHIPLKKNNDTTVVINVSAEELKSLPAKDFELMAYVAAGDKTWDKSQHTIKYEHLPTLQYYTNATTKILLKNWQCKAKLVGYIEGAGDDVSESLQFAGLKVDILKESDITAAKLKKYDAIITGIRALNTQDKMQLWMPELLQYVKNGGTLVMQYNTSHRLVTDNIGPYPISLSRDRVTEEDATVEILDPKHKLLNYPNKITQDDFDNWVQERGLYFADKWDEHYTPLFSMHDTGEDALKGSTLYTQYGKGNYIYTPLSFFRQLPAGNKGALRLLLNFISAGN